MLRYNQIQNDINNFFLDSLCYLLKISPEKAEEHFDTVESICYRKYRHYPNIEARKQALSLISETNAWGYFNG